MRFLASDEAAAVREAAAQLLRIEVTPAVIRTGWPAGDAGTVRAIWRKLAATGAVGVLAPEELGGLGLDEVALVALLEELGASGLPVPAAETIAVAAPLLAADDGLADVLSGDAFVAVGTKSTDDSWLVPFGASAEYVLLGDEKLLRLHRREELEVEPLAAVDGSRALARVRPGSPGTRYDARIANLRGVLGTSALLIGLSRRMLELTVDYVGTRTQFGSPIGSFQAIKHALASAVLAVEFAAPAVAAAAWALAHQNGTREVAAAKLLTSEAARTVARTAIQCHGAMGYTTEYDLHLYVKRAWALSASWGDPAAQRALLAKELRV